MANKSTPSKAEIGCGLIAIIGGLIYLLFSLLADLALIVLALLPLVLPPLFLIAGLVYYRIYKKNDMPVVLNNFRLSTEDIQTLGVQYAKIKLAENKISQHKEGIQTGRIRINKDGSINRKQRGGYDIEGALNHAQTTIDTIKPQHLELLKKQEKMYKRAKQHFSKYWAYLVSIIVFIISLLILSEWKPITAYSETYNSIRNAEKSEIKETKTNTTNSTEKNDTEYKYPAALFDATTYMVIAIIIALITYRIVFNIKYKKIFKKAEDEAMSKSIYITAQILEKEGL